MYHVWITCEGLEGGECAHLSGHTCKAVDRSAFILYFKTIDIIEIMENHLEKIRPREEIRSQLDIGYTIEKQSIILNEIRPVWRDPSVYKEYGFAKTTYVKSKNVWKVYWMRADLKWHPYDPKPEVKTLQQFLKIVDEDKYHCFKG